MFGYVTANYESLSEESKKRYKAYYCGLCRTLGNEYGVFSRMTLTYDMTFMIIVLTSLAVGIVNMEGDENCFIHPIKKQPFIINEFTFYAADMNIIFSYYNLIDKWHDDRNIFSAVETRILASAYKKAVEKQPEMNTIVMNHLEELSLIEKKGETNPDIPADCFGRLLGKVFVCGDSESFGSLYRFGYSLGKFVYIADAVDDLKRDLKKERYNPLMTVPKENYTDILKLLIAECTENFSALDSTKDRDIIENVLYSGIWTAYPPFRDKNKEAADK